MQRTELKTKWLRTLFAERRDIFEEQVPLADIQHALDTNQFYGLHFHEIALVTSQSEQIIIVLLDDKNNWLSSTIAEID